MLFYIAKQYLIFWKEREEKVGKLMLTESLIEF